MNQEEVTFTFRNHGSKFNDIINSICGSWRQSTVGDYLEHVSLFTDITPRKCVLCMYFKILNPSSKKDSQSVCFAEQPRWARKSMERILTILNKEKPRPEFDGRS